MQLPWKRNDQWPRVERVLVGTDRSETAERAVRWAADMATRFDAELVVLQVIRDGLDAAETQSALEEYARGLEPARARAITRMGEDPARVIVDAAEDEAVDVIVVGSVGMSGRKEFLLENVPNRVSHQARCTVVIVKTHDAP